MIDTWRRTATLGLDVLLLVCVCALQALPFTGLVLHEWLGMAMVAMVFTHLLLSWKWIASESRRFFALQSLRARINYLLNLSLFGAVVAVIFTGVLISKQAVPWLTGTIAAPDMDWRWDTLHHWFSTAVVILAGFHLAVNWELLLGTGQKIFRRLQEGAM